MSWSVVIEFFKKYWWVAIIVAVFVYSEMRIYNMKSILEATIKSNEAQISKITEIHSQEIVQRDKAIKESQEKLQEIEKDYAEQTRILEETKRQRIKTIVKYYTENPKTLADKIVERYGFVYVETNNSISR